MSLSGAILGGDCPMEMVEVRRDGRLCGKYTFRTGSTVSDIEGQRLFEGDILGAVDERGISIVSIYKEGWILVFANLDIADIQEATKRKVVGNTVNDMHMLEDTDLMAWYVAMTI